MKYSAILFDLDGTLLDTSEGLLLSINETIAQCGFADISLEQKRSMIGPPINQSLQNIYQLTDAQAAEAAAVFRRVYAERFLLKAVPYPGVMELLHKLRKSGWQTGVATYKRNDYAQLLMQEMGITDLCHFSLGSAGGSQTKAEIIQLCLKALDCSPECCIMVGDTIHDLIGARDAGLAFVGVTYGFGFRTREEILSQGGIAAADTISCLTSILQAL